MGELVVDLLLKGRVLRTVPFDRPSLRIGRMRENDIVVDNLSVSRFHGRLHLEGGRVFLEDAGSENGTFVNDTRIHGRVELAPGDRIAIGKHQLRVRTRRPDELLEGDAAATTAPARSDPPDETDLAEPPPREAPGAAFAAAPAGPPAPAEAVTGPDETTGPPDPARPAPAAAGAGASHAGLIVQRDGRIERVLAWEADELIIGRAADCDLVLGQDEVSRRHARLVRRDGRYEVHDLGSVNGTLVNGERIERCELAVGDVVQIESFQLTFVLDHEPITGAVASPSPAALAPTREHDTHGVTIVGDALPLLDEIEEPAGPQGAPKPDAAASPAAEPESDTEATQIVVEAGEPACAAALEVDLLGAEDGSDEAFGPAAPSLDERKELAAAQPRRSSRASSIQALRPAPDPARHVVLELHLRLEALPEPLQRALAELGASGVEIPAEVRLRPADATPEPGAA